MSKSGVLLIGTGAVVALIAAKMASVKEGVKYLEYNLNGIDFNVTNLLSPELTVRITITNPNKISVNVTEITGSILNGATILGTFKNSSPVSLTGLTTQIISLTAKINALSVIAQLFAKSKTPEVTIGGVIKTAFYDLPFSKTLNMNTGLINGVGNTSFNVKMQRVKEFSKLKKRNPGESFKDWVKRMKLLSAKRRSFLQTGVMPNLPVSGTSN